MLQEFHQQLFVQRNPMFQQAEDFLYQPIDSDTVTPDVLLLKSENVRLQLKMEVPLLQYNPLLTCPNKVPQLSNTKYISCSYFVKTNLFDDTSFGNWCGKELATWSETLTQAVRLFIRSVSWVVARNHTGQFRILSQINKITTIFMCGMSIFF